MNTETEIKITEQKNRKTLYVLSIKYVLCLFYAYVYEDILSKDFHLNQGFQEHYVMKWDIYIKKKKGKISRLGIKKPSAIIYRYDWLQKIQCISIEIFLA